MKLTLNKNYLTIAIGLFITEALIAYYFKSGFIRHTFGDYLVVMLIYCCIKIVVKGHNNTIALCVLGFAFIIEFLQYFNVMKHINPNNNLTLNLLLGSTFQVSDLVAYTLGVLTLLIIENYRK